MEKLFCLLVGTLSVALALPAFGQDIAQARGADQSLDYQSLTRFGPWDDRNYALTTEDLEWLAPNETELHPGIPAFFRIELRKEWPHLQKSGPAQYPRAARQLFKIRHGGLMHDGVIQGSQAGQAGRASVTIDGELKISDVLDADEVTVEINPVFPTRVIAGSNSSGAVFGQKMYFSADGGVTWGIGSQGSANGILDNTCCDPTVGWSSDGTIAYAAALSNSIGVSFYRSTDFGQTWSAPNFLTAFGSDKEFLHVDISSSSASQDNVYLTYHNGNVMQFARSTNLGVSFTIKAFNGGPGQLVSAPTGIGSDITTDSDGNVYYIYASFGTITLLKSTNGGVSFQSPVTISATNGVFDYPIPSMETRRAWTYATADADRSGGPFDGNIYAAWTDTDAPDSNFDPNANHTRIVVARSSDGGATWQTSIPHPTADIETVDRFNQWMTVDEDGVVHVVFYDTQNSANRSGVDLYYANSDDGAVTWNAPERISTTTSTNVTNFQEWGDYNGISVIDGKIVTTWTDNRGALSGSTDAFAARLSLDLLSLDVISPNGGEIFIKGTTEQITWSSDGDIGPNVSIKVMKGANSFTLTSSTPDDGSFDWLIPNFAPETSDYTVEVASVDIPSLSDESDAPFSIASAGAGDTITVLSPNGGETLIRGTAETISWTSSGNIGPDVSVTLIRGLQSLTLSNSTTDDGSFQWNIPAFIGIDSTYRIEVASVSDPSITDTSDGTFNIGDAAPVGTITVLTPNGGEVIQTGTSTPITWSTTGVIGNWVVIRLVQDLSVPPFRATIISRHTENDGSFTWDVPFAIPTQVNYLIELSSLSDPSIIDTSDGVFTIQP